MRLSAWCSTAGAKYSVIPYLLSSVGSTDLVEVKVSFHIGKTHRTERLDALFEALGTDDGEGRNPLSEIDGCLSSARFSKLGPGKLIIGIAFSTDGIGHSTLGVTDEQWGNLVRGKISCADKRDILRSVPS